MENLINYWGCFMFEFSNLHCITVTLIFFVLVVVVFFILLMFYLNFYFNRYEPVYVLNDKNVKVKNALTSRFCKIIIANTITDQCIHNTNNVGLWLLVSNIISGWPRDEVMSLQEIHTLVLKDIYFTDNDVKYDQLVENLSLLDTALNSNLLKSNMTTPPYLYTHIYASWITNVLNTLNNP